MTLYTTTVQNIGAEAELFKEEQMIVLFGENAPAELADFCYNIQVNPVEGEITLGQKVYFDDQGYEITAVGNVVVKNLSDLGHITIRFNGDTEAELGGTLYVENKELPEISVGTQISIK
ncbi:PTS glucitol/sorbitol transporter subunit IIA [Aerococcaceae bacterium WGS1372]